MEIDCALLEPPKDESGMKVKVYLGSGVFGCCNKMFYRGNPVAVKTFYSATAEEVKQEARVMSKFKHANFPLLIGMCTLSKPYHLVSSFYHVLDNPYTLSLALKSRSLNLSQVIWLTLINQLAQAISYVYKQGFLHRDIKADNVLISHVNNEYCAILIDFGKCVALTAVGSLVKHFTPEEQKLYKSKHGHIAPEIVCGASPPSHANDVFSFGRVICAVGTYLQCHFLCTLGKKCILSDPELRPQLSEIIEARGATKITYQVINICLLTNNPVETVHCFLDFLGGGRGGVRNLFFFLPRLVPTRALKAFSMAHCRLANDEMAHLVSQCFCGTAIV